MFGIFLANIAGKRDADRARENCVCERGRNPGAVASGTLWSPMKIDSIILRMRSDKSDFRKFFFIVDLCYQAVRIVHDLKPCPIIFDHLRPRKISKNILPAIPLGLLYNIFPCGHALPCIRTFLSELVQPVQIKDNHRKGLSPAS